MILIETDSQGQATLPGHPNEWFLLRENGDVSILLEPVHPDARAQADYYADADLQVSLTRASHAPAITRNRTRR